MKKYKQELLLLGKTVGLFLLMFTFSEIMISVISLFIDLSTLNKNILQLIFLGIDLLLMVILFFSYRKTLIEDGKAFIKNFSDNVNIAFKYWLTGLIVMMVSNLLINMFTSSIANNEESVRSLLSVMPLYMIFDIVLYAPFTEELIFRKSFRDIFKSKWLYIIASGFTFGALHVVSSVEVLSDLLYLIPYCALGFAFSSLYYKTNNIFSSISMHFFHNTMTLVLLLLSGQVL